MSLTGILLPDVPSRRDFLASCATAAAMAILPATSPAAQGAGKNTPTGPLAMWALTGTLKSDDVRRQLDQFHDAGWGVVLYPRWGLEIEYLGDAWFDRMRFIVAEAASRHMEVWLYDEFCWPSGHAKGLVTKDHEHLEAQLLQVQRDGRSSVVRVPGSANLLMPEATARFIEVTHERYAAAIGKYFGSTVRAIFTDEPSLALQHQPRGKDTWAWQVAWSDALQEALGGDFQKRLAKAGGDVAVSPLWRDYWAAYTRVFHDAWVAPIAGWCKRHKIAFSGHLLGEGSFGSQVAYNGSLRRQLGEFGIPGIDEIATRTEPDRCEALTLASIAEFPGRERMVEVFALGPPSMSLDTMCRMVDLCAACGVDRYVLAICPHDLSGGLKKREYLGVYGPQQPWFRECAKPFAQYVAEAAHRAYAAKPFGLAWPSDEDLWAAAGPAPTRSARLGELTQKAVAAAREVVRARLQSKPPPAAAARRDLHVAWTFAAQGENSLRIEGATLTVADLPKKAQLSVQSQLVRSLRLNGKPVNLATAPADHRFDSSYRRVSIVDLLRVGENRIEVESTEPKPLKYLPALVLWGDFAVDAQGRLVAPSKTIQAGDWRQQGYPAFCGTGRYTATISFDKNAVRLGVDAGGYPVRTFANGKSLGLRMRAPFLFDLRDAVRPGRNEIVIEITSTLGHLVVPKESPAVGLLRVWVEG